VEVNETFERVKEKDLRESQCGSGNLERVAKMTVSLRRSKGISTSQHACTSLKKKTSQLHSIIIARNIYVRRDHFCSGNESSKAHLSDN